MRKAQHVVVNRRGSATDVGSLGTDAARQLLACGTGTLASVVTAMLLHGAAAAAQTLPAASNNQLAQLISVPASCRKAYELGPQQEYGPNYTPGPACEAAAACADSIDQLLAQADAYLARNPVLAQQLDALDRARYQSFELISDIRYHLRVQRGTVNTGRCSGAIASLAGFYYKGDARLGAEPPFQRLVNAAQQLTADAAAQLAADLASAANVRQGLAGSPGMAQFEQAEAAYRRAAEGGDAGAALAARPRFLSALAVARADAGKLKAHAALLERRRQNSAELVAALNDGELAPFVEDDAAAGARQLAARTAALASGTGAQEGDQASELAALRSGLERVRLQFENARRERSGAKGRHDSLVQALARARALLEAADEPRLRAALAPEDVADLRAVATTIQGFLDLPLHDLANRQSGVEQAESTLARLTTAVDNARAAARPPTESDASGATTQTPPAEATPGMGQLTAGDAPQAEALAQAITAFLRSADAMPRADALDQIGRYLEATRAFRGSMDLWKLETQLMDKRYSLQQTAEADQAQDQLFDQSTDPYTDIQMMGGEMLLLLSNPLNIAEAETRLRRKGIKEMSVLAARMAPEGGNWLVQFIGDGPLPEPDQGFFCRVSGSDARSMAQLRNLSAGRPRMIVSGTVGEYVLQAEPPPGMIRIVFDPCTIDDVPAR